MIRFQYNDGGRALYFRARKVGDCVTRAIAIAKNEDYKAVYEEARAFLGYSPRNGVENKNVRKLLAHFGGEWHPTMTIGSGCKVHLREDELPKGRIVCNCSGHLTAVIDGVLMFTRWHSLCIRILDFLKHKTMIEAIKTQKCRCCGKELPLTEYGESIMGRYYTCKSCVAENQRKGRAKKKEAANKEAELQRTRSLKLSDYTPRELMQELKRRGYSFRMEYTETHIINSKDI